MCRFTEKAFAGTDGLLVSAFAEEKTHDPTNDGAGVLGGEEVGAKGKGGGHHEDDGEPAVRLVVVHGVSVNEIVVGGIVIRSVKWKIPGCGPGTVLMCAG